MGRTHAATGAALWLAGCATVQAAGLPLAPATVAVGAALCVAGALLPDIDQPGSTAARCAGWASWTFACGVAAVCRWLHAATRTRRDRVDEDGHRTATHTALFALLVGFTSGVIGGWLDPRLAVVGVRPAGWWWGLALGVGCLAHCLGDACTNQGVPLLYPLVIRGQRWYPVRLPVRWRRRTGVGWFEVWVRWASLVVVAGAAVVLARPPT